MKPALGVLCYHRVVEDADVEGAWPYFERGTAVRASTFRAQLGAISAFADLVSEAIALDVLAGRHRLARPAVWLTFDDGYRDVLGAVSYAAAGTVFVTTSASTRPLPADAWYAVLLSANRRHGVIDLGRGPFEYNLEHREGRARLVNGPERRAYLRARPSAQASTLTSLVAQMDGSAEASRDLYLKAEELDRLRAPGWSLGSHGVSHTPFDVLDAELIDREARDSFAWLSKFGPPVRSLALPDGSVPDVPASLRAAGYECVLGLGNAPADIEATVTSRFVVPDALAWIRATLQPGIS